MQAACFTTKRTTLSTAASQKIMRPSPYSLPLHFRRCRLPRPQRLPQRRGASTPAKDTAPVPSHDEGGAGLILQERGDGYRASSPPLPLETLVTAGRAKGTHHRRNIWNRYSIIYMEYPGYIPIIYWETIYLRYIPGIYIHDKSYLFFGFNACIACLSCAIGIHKFSKTGDHPC